MGEGTQTKRKGTRRMMKTKREEKGPMKARKEGTYEDTEEEEETEERKGKRRYESGSCRLSGECCVSGNQSSGVLEPFVTGGAVIVLPGALIRILQVTEVG